MSGHKRSRVRSDSVGILAWQMRTRENIVPQSAAPDGTTPEQAARDIAAIKSGAACSSGSPRDDVSVVQQQHSLALDAGIASLPKNIGFVARYLLSLLRMLMLQHENRRVVISRTDKTGFKVEFDRIDKTTGMRSRITLCFNEVDHDDM